jgi:hypothetical protein
VVVVVPAVAQVQEKHVLFVMIIMAIPAVAVAVAELAVKGDPAVLAAVGLLPCMLTVLLREQIFQVPCLIPDLQAWGEPAVPAALAALMVMEVRVIAVVQAIEELVQAAGVEDMAALAAEARMVLAVSLIKCTLSAPGQAILLHLFQRLRLYRYRIQQIKFATILKYQLQKLQVRGYYLVD